MPLFKSFPKHEMLPQVDPDHLLNKGENQSTETLTLQNYDEKKTWRSKARFTALLPLATGLSLVLIIMTLTSFLAVARKADHLPPEAPALAHSNDVGTLHGSYSHCGSSAQEAMALGCEFDIMLFAWVPAGCRNKAMSDWTLDSNGPFIFTEDEAGTKFLPQDEEVLKHYDLVWTTRSYHIAHCAYGMKLMVYGGMGKRNIATMEKVLHWNHTVHCEELINREPVKNVSTVDSWLQMMYQGCSSLW